MHLVGIGMNKIPYSILHWMSSHKTDCRVLLLFHQPQLRTDKDPISPFFLAYGMLFRESKQLAWYIKPDMLAIYTDIADQLNGSCMMDANCGTDKHKAGRPIIEHHTGSFEQCQQLRIGSCCRIMAGRIR